MSEEKDYPTWKERGYKDTRNRNGRRFFMLEQTDESKVLVQQARARLAIILGVPNTKQALPDAKVMREALRYFARK